MVFLRKERILEIHDCLVQFKGEGLLQTVSPQNSYDEALTPNVTYKVFKEVIGGGWGGNAWLAQSVEHVLISAL